jgi:hypothetical protein
VNRLNVSVFRLTLQELSEVTEVTIGGKVVGTWLPAHSTHPLALPSGRNVVAADIAPQVEVPTATFEVEQPDEAAILAARDQLRKPTRPRYDRDAVLRRVNRSKP